MMLLSSSYNCIQIYIYRIVEGLYCNIIVFVERYIQCIIFTKCIPDFFSFEYEEGEAV